MVNAMIFNSVYFSSSELAYSKTARGTKTAMQWNVSANSPV